MKMAARFSPDGLPGDEHRHHGGLASAGGQFESQTHQLRIGVVVGVDQVLQEGLARLAGLRATSVSQIPVSTASTWQKNGRTPLKS
jgi:hypothetical protein